MTIATYMPIVKFGEHWWHECATPTPYSEEQIAQTGVGGRTPAQQDEREWKGRGGGGVGQTTPGHKMCFMSLLLHIMHADSVLYEDSMFERLHLVGIALPCKKQIMAAFSNRRDGREMHTGIYTEGSKPFLLKLAPLLYSKALTYKLRATPSDTGKSTAKITSSVYLRGPSYPSLQYSATLATLAPPLQASCDFE